MRGGGLKLAKRFVRSLKTYKQKKIAAQASKKRTGGVSGMSKKKAAKKIKEMQAELDFLRG